MSVKARLAALLASFSVMGAMVGWDCSHWRSELPDIDATPALLEEILGRAQRWPERPAVVDADSGQSLTYGGLAEHELTRGHFGQGTHVVSGHPRAAGAPTSDSGR